MGATTGRDGAVREIRRAPSEHAEASRDRARDRVRRRPSAGEARRGTRETRATARRCWSEESGRARRAMGKGAFRAFSGAIDVTPEMARELIVALKREKFEFVVAPYEADAHDCVARRARRRNGGGVDLVFTEDSDLVAYGCPRVVFKLEKSGDAKELRLASLFEGAARATSDDDGNAER